MVLPDATNSDTSAIQAAAQVDEADLAGRRILPQHEVHIPVKTQPERDEEESSSDGDKKKKKKDDGDAMPPVSILKLFSCASSFEFLLSFVGIVSAIGGGVAFPLLLLYFGDLIKAFVSNAFDPSGICEMIPEACCNELGLPTLDNPLCPITPEMVSNVYEDLDFMDEIEKFCLRCALIATAEFICGYLFVMCLNLSAERQVHTLRIRFLEGILRQDIGWYDTHQTGDFASKMAEDLNKIQEGIGEKIGMFFFLISIFVCCITLAFIKGWELTLVIMSVMPLLGVSAAVIAKSQTSMTAKEVKSYSRAGAMAEEVLGAVRTVVAFGGEKKEVQRYEDTLQFSRKANIMRGVMTGIGGGIMWLCVFSSYALAFWYGVKLIMDDREKCAEFLAECEAAGTAEACQGGCEMDYDSSNLMVIFFSVLFGAYGAGQAIPHIEAFSVARGSAAKIFDIIERVPNIDSSSTEGREPKRGGGNIKFRGVHFHYPSRPDVKILQGLDLDIRKGETVALVGPSGCGKSTVIQLIQRFYDPLAGRVELEGDDIRELNLGKMRNIIGIVGQEPVLFDCSIAENIRMGRDNVTEEEMINATKEANAYNFIMKLPKRFDTNVGERGAQLSGGQKQRIAIARALVRNPEVLLLDEATSALDTQSESTVQAALDKVSSTRTTVVVAHRLSTIRTADKIVAIKDGKVAEIGSHDELMKLQGLYFGLVTAQLTGEEDKEAQGEEAQGEQDASSNPKRMMTQASLATQQSVESVGSAAADEYVDVENNSGPRKRKKKFADRLEFFSKGKADDNDLDLPKVSTRRLYKMNRPEWGYMFVGMVASCLVGASMPAFAILFGEVLGVLSKDIETARDDSVDYAILFAVIGVVVGISMFFQTYMFSISGAHLTLRMRRMTLETMLKQEMGWFDDAKNSTGALCSRLSADAAAVQGATGTRLGTILQSCFTVLVSTGLALYYEWRLGLVTSCFTPLILASLYFQTMILMGNDALEKQALEKSSKLAIEAIGNIRTVAGLRREHTFVEKYRAELEVSQQKISRKSHLRGLVFGFAQSMTFYSFATCMYYGGNLVEKEDVDYEDVFKVASALILGTMVVGQAAAFAPNYNAGVIAAARIFHLLDRKPEIDSTGSSGLKVNRVDGNIEFKEAEFRYPSRKQVKILKQLSLSIEAGQKIALVGPSGCGKSTCIQLLQRFYNLEGGALDLEGYNIESLNVPCVRANLGIVSQEPTLFDRTLGENIAYGDNERKVSMDEIIDAAKKANVHNFISNLPLGYDTRVGEKGTQLSGGQKQRIAIARALIRNPKILLLDEATSALDTESEKVVQEALDAAQEGRTSISIAHRLSTIQNVDQIFVIDHGKVAEMGTHNDLLAKGGIYHKLWFKQGGKKNN